MPYKIYLLLLFQNDDAPVSLMEMRFHIPSSELAGDVDPVEAFHQQVCYIMIAAHNMNCDKTKKCDSLYTKYFLE